MGPKKEYDRPDEETATNQATMSSPTSSTSTIEFDSSPGSSANSNACPPVSCVNSENSSPASSPNSYACLPVSCVNSENSSPASSPNSYACLPVSCVNSENSSPASSPNSYACLPVSCVNSENSSPGSSANSYACMPSRGDVSDKNRSCCYAKRNVVAGVVFPALVAIATAVGVYFVTIASVVDEDRCQFLLNEIICPFKQEYFRIDILNPPIHLKNGEGRTSYELTKDTDITLDGFNIRVKDQQITVQKQPYDCAEEGDYPIMFSGTNSTQLEESKLSLKVKDISDAMLLEITPFTNASDNKDYVQITCTGYHQCGTVVVDLELHVVDFGTYNKPMDCSRTNTDGKAMENYGYLCTLIMSVEMFQRTENLKCKPTVESLQNATTKYFARQSVDVNETTRSRFSLEQGLPATIKWNVNVQTLNDIRHLQTKHNGVFHANKSDPDARCRLSISIKGYIATCEVVFRPVTCIDAGTWQLDLLNGDKQRKDIQVNGLSTFTACPSLIDVSVGDQLKLQFHSCVSDDVRTYLLSLYGNNNRSGSFETNETIEILDQSNYFRGTLYLNELSVTYIKRQPVTCADHQRVFNMSLGTARGDTIQDITSLTNVIVNRSRYETFSTGGDFRENFPAVVNLRIHLGCRPQRMKIYVNGSLLISGYNLTEDINTGEKTFSKSFIFPKLSMHVNGTTVDLNSSFVDDEGAARNLRITQVIRVVQDTFCQEKPYGCNYRHPYNNNMMVACGEGLIADLRHCQPGLVFVKSNCVGQCCPEGATTNCQRA